MGEFLVKESLVTLEQVEEAYKIQRHTGGRFTSILLDLDYISEAELTDILSEKYDYSVIDLNNFEIEKEALKLIPKTVCEKYGILPLSKADNILIVAISDPTSSHIKNDLALMTRCKVEFVIASESAIRRDIDGYYGYSVKFQTILSELENDVDSTVKVNDNAYSLTKVKPTDGPVVKFINLLLSEAIRTKASDIHIEPYEKRLRIRFRLDGSLIQKMEPIQGVAAALTSRIKVMSNLDISERRHPQDGRLKVRLEKGKDVDFRVSCLPTLFGEKIVLRVLDKSNLQVDMKKLGFEEEQLGILLKAIDLPQGMILITGPTGSGKTTTIYSCLEELNQPKVNISTAEDPVEFNLDGINQVQINHEINFTFANALRSFLRQDPDIIMVGEIRDLETANVAYKAASTGHLVVSTLHTNDSISTVGRLLDMGLANFLVAESTTLIVAQRLLKTNCSKCTEKVAVPHNILLDLGVSQNSLDQFQNLQRGQGCNHCGETGLAGRIAIHEVLPMSDEIKTGILKGLSPIELKKRAIESGMMTLRVSALEKLKKGLTTVEEVLNSSIGD